MRDTFIDSSTYVEFINRLHSSGLTERTKEDLFALSQSGGWIKVINQVLELLGKKPFPDLKINKEEK